MLTKHIKFLLKWATDLDLGGVLYEPSLTIKGDKALGMVFGNSSEFANFQIALTKL